MKAFTKKILLASQSPRRQHLLKDCGFDVSIIKIDVEETFDPSLQAQEIPLFLSQKKAAAYQLPLAENEVLVTSDTIVWLKNKVLNKPENMQEAKQMLLQLSGNEHTVYTAVTLKTNKTTFSFFDESKVQFNSLSEEIIDYYLTKYKPLDKAGAYGVQEFIGYVGIQKIEGCYYNIMGFPLAKFFKEIENLI